MRNIESVKRQGRSTKEAQIAAGQRAFDALLAEFGVEQDA